mmetsp:Transcript_17211/g.22810  ORF Transcript_17211/g.22810 Transcript_17211/m.22810 type:complete len:802 (+) Transcript_17211:3-2408(+)
MESSASHGGYYAATAVSNQMNTANTNMMMNEGGVINFSFYVSGHDDTDISLTSSSGSNAPFAKHTISPVPTPYGKLHVTGLYDAALDVETLLQHYHSHAVYPIPTPTRGMPIPIQHHGSAVTATSHQINQQHQQQLSGNMLIPPIRPSSLPGGSTMNSLNSHSPHTTKTIASNSPLSPMVPTPFIIQNYTDTQSPHNSPQIRPLQRIPLRKAHSAISEQEIAQQESFEKRHYNQEGDENEGARAGINANGKKRVLSALSLALMNEDQKNNALDDQRQNVDGATSPHGSCSGRKGTIDEVTVLRHRLALHHPPPMTFDVYHQNQQHQQQASSSSPKGYMDNLNNTSVGGGNYNAGEYGYGYNNGNVHVKQQTAVVEGPAGYNNDVTSNSGGGGVGSLGTSPSPMINTPPQPMFLTNVMGDNGGAFTLNTAAVVPPFNSNPITLQPYPSSSHEHTTSISMRKVSMAQDGSGAISSKEITTKHHQQQQYEASDDATPNLLLPPLTSLDLLQKSPFKHPSNQMGIDNASLLSSLSFGGAAASTAYSAAALGVDETNNGGYGGSGSAFGGGGATVPGSELLTRNSTALGSLQGFNANTAFDNYNRTAEPSNSFEDMPFAVDMSPSSSGGFLSGCFTTSSGAGGGAANHTTNDPTGLSGGIGVSVSTSSSLAVTSLAHRCATAGRLKLFSNDAQEGIGGDSLGQGHTQSERENSRVNGGFGTETRERFDAENNGVCVISSKIRQGEHSRNEAVGNKKSDVSLLADQLAEFRSFGASLSIGGSTGATSFVTAPTGDVKTGSSAVEAGA